MPQIEVVTNDGVVQQQVISRDAAIIPSQNDQENGVGRFEPAVVQSIEYDHEGDSSAATTVCGETENRRTSDENPEITIEGIITEEQLDTIKSLKRGDEITLISDIEQGQVFVRRVTINQSSDLIGYLPDGADKAQLAMNFQLQLKKPQ